MSIEHWTRLYCYLKQIPICKIGYRDIQINLHCVKSVHIQSFSLPCSVRIREKTNKKNSEYRQFSRSAKLSLIKCGVGIDSVNRYDQTEHPKCTDTYKNTCVLKPKYNSSVVYIFASNS